MQHDKVSVIIPCYNAEKYLQETINSLLNQSYHNCEFVIVNDGSTDKTVDIVNENKEKDDRILLINKPNGGISSARSEGIINAHGQYIIFCDSDDVLYPDSVEILVKSIKQNNCDICIGSYKTFFDKPDINIERSDYLTKKMDKEDLLKELSICNQIQNFLWGKIYKSTILNAIKFNQSYRVWEDVREMFRILDNCENGVFIDTPVVLYRQTSGSLSNQLDLNKLSEFCRAQMDKALFYLDKYPKLAKYHCESMFQCGAEIVSRNMENDVLLFDDFLSVYKRIAKKASLRNKLKYMLIKHKRLYKVLKRK